MKKNALRLPLWSWRSSRPRARLRCMRRRGPRATAIGSKRASPRRMSRLRTASPTSASSSSSTPEAVHSRGSVRDDLPRPDSGPPTRPCGPGSWTNAGIQRITVAAGVLVIRELAYVCRTASGPMGSGTWTVDGPSSTGLFAGARGSGGGTADLTAHTSTLSGKLDLAGADHDQVHETPGWGALRGRSTYGRSRSMEGSFVTSGNVLESEVEPGQQTGSKRPKSFGSTKRRRIARNPQKLDE